MNNSIPVSDGFVTLDDFAAIHDAVARRDLERLICEQIIREPQIGFGVTEQLNSLLALLEGASMSIQQRAAIKIQLVRLAWLPLLALARAHRRAWEDFLPSTQEPENTDTE